MASQRSREHEIQTPLCDGEFERIHGIGPGIAHRLHDAGIHTFRQLASLTPDEISATLNKLVGMTAEHIAHQDWAGQARLLDQQLAEVDPPSEHEEPAARQHYASFMVELLQDETNAVRRTRVVHIQTGEKDNWAGWNGERLEDWIVGKATIVNPQSSVHSSPQPDEDELTPPVDAQQFLDGKPEIRLMVDGIYPPGEAHSRRFLDAGQPFEIHVSFDTTGEDTQPAGVPLRYRAIVYARLAGDKQKQIAEISGQCVTGDVAHLIIPVEGLEQGAYHLETVLLFNPRGSVRPEKEGRQAILESGLVYVFPQETALAV